MEGELNARVWASIKERVEHGEDESAFMVVDLADVDSKVRAWRALLPRVEPFYAVKCHDDPQILRRLVKLGVGFDCASKGEIDLVLDAGASPEDIIFAHPCKAQSHLLHAAQVGAEMMTFDNDDELFKIKRHFPGAKILLRLLPDDSSAVCQLGVKFGADIKAVRGLMQTCLDLDLNLVGVSYHVGSGCQDIAAFSEAVHLARRAFDIAEELGIQLSILDIGGGFPGESVRHWKAAAAAREAAEFNGVDDESLEAKGDARLFPALARQLGPTLDQLFPAESGVRIIAEPGRYMVHSSCTLVANVLARRRTVVRNTEVFRYYINEGVYGSFNNIIYDHATVQGFPLRVRGRRQVEREALRRSGSGEDPLAPGAAESDFSDDDEAAAGSSSENAVAFVGEVDGEQLCEGSVWGPTCDGLDCVLKDSYLPRLEVGDWMYFPDMGAYTVAAAAKFNGFEIATKVYI
ncbi:Ornithine decarboxylase [Hondaea fermentalgiana]|uniref:ornithine decarboxylase n=1 Tax=Hondaea fermentalgiana TaxID=2315210 RepID=A0A2R5GMD3_9STRA|nr:Ornithine decarboxylase [Hondaea fermentalgiana]|eukprot:GBG29461.1 Ornithine decarboxylase [Hondaea fermentalgiana]